jgi:hypothetical protein
MFLFRKCLCALLVAFGLVGFTISRADEPPVPRDALDRLLDKIDKDTSTSNEKDAAKDKDKSRGEVAPKDKALDNLLEKLGETRDKPEAPDERRGGPPMPGEEDKGQGKKDQGPKQELTGKTKDLDEHLEELTGRKRKKKNQQEDGSGPLGQVIKEMREVEQRLGKTDTGEETRKKQTEIVKNLQQLIEQLQQSSGQSKGKRIRMVMEQGEQGKQKNQEAGANAAGAPSTKPARPDGKRANVGGKDVWGHLPDELRQEMDNVAREGVLLSKEKLIQLYYLSVGKKSLTREE